MSTSSRDSVSEHRGAAERGSISDSYRRTPRGHGPRCERCAQRPPSSHLPCDPIMKSRSAWQRPPARRSLAGWGRRKPRCAASGKRRGIHAGEDVQQCGGTSEQDGRVGPPLRNGLSRRPKSRAGIRREMEEGNRCSRRVGPAQQSVTALAPRSKHEALLEHQEGAAPPCNGRLGSKCVLRGARTLGITKIWRTVYSKHKTASSR